MTLREFIHYSFFGNTIEQYLVGAAIFIGSLLLIGMTKYVVVARMKKLTKKTETGVDEVLVSGIDKNMIPLLLVVALYVSLQGLHLNASLQRMFHIGVSMLLIFFSVRFLLSIVTYGLDRQWKRTGVYSAAGLFPLFFKRTDSGLAASVVRSVRQSEKISRLRISKTLIRLTP